MSRYKKLLVAQHLVEGQFPVMWYWVRETGYHSITYGGSHQLYDDSAAAAEAFGYAVHHQVECDGRLDQ